MGGWFARARSLWRGLRRPERLASEMEEEMRFHIEMEAERIVREQRVAPAEARRRAGVGFGGLEKRKEEGREVRGLAWLSGVSLDLKLAWRMLLKSPGLSMVGVLGISLGIAVGVGFFIVLSAIVNPAGAHVDLRRRDRRADADGGAARRGWPSAEGVAGSADRGVAGGVVSAAVREPPGKLRKAGPDPGSGRRSDWLSAEGRLRRRLIEYRCGMQTRAASKAGQLLVGRA